MSESACRHPEVEELNSERERLILEHVPQVRLIARRIHERLPVSVNLEDLVSAGILGLISAVDNFDPAQKVKLKTYAEYKIRGAILDSLRALDWVPREQRKRAKRIQVAISATEQRLGRSAEDEEIAAELGLSVADYHEWLVDLRVFTINSLNEETGFVEGGERLNSLADKTGSSPLKVLEETELETLVASGIARMPPVKRDVLSLYYQKELTLREIAQMMNLHPSRISQLKSQAILRLRSYVEAHWPGSRGSLP